VRRPPRTHCTVRRAMPGPRTVGHAGPKEGGPCRVQGRWAMPGQLVGPAGPPVAVHRCDLRRVVRNGMPSHGVRR
jgi:hypothetical protein